MTNHKPEKVLQKIERGKRCGVGIKKGGKIVYDRGNEEEGLAPLSGPWLMLVDWHAVAVAEAVCGEICMNENGEYKNEVEVLKWRWNQLEICKCAP